MTTMVMSLRFVILLLAERDQPKIVASCNHIAVTVDDNRAHICQVLYDQLGAAITIGLRGENWDEGGGVV